jgi:hypothetical protein
MMMVRTSIFGVVGRVEDTGEVLRGTHGVLATQQSVSRTSRPTSGCI